MLIHPLIVFGLMLLFDRSRRPGRRPVLMASLPRR